MVGKLKVRMEKQFQEVRGVEEVEEVENFLWQLEV
jgi:hypothetical protein